MASLRTAPSNVTNVKPKGFSSFDILIDDFAAYSVIHFALNSSFFHEKYEFTLFSLSTHLP